MDVRVIRIDKIRPNPFQPRETFAKEDIQELAGSIKRYGLLQPISVRDEGDSYQIIAGERRWRASQFAGLQEIPAVVKSVSDEELMVLSLIENVQRKDLEPLEKGRGLAEVYRLGGIEPTTVGMKLHVIDNKIKGYASYDVGTPLSEEEEKLKRIADSVDLSYDYQYRLLNQLKLSKEERKRVSELSLGYEEISSIATIEEDAIRKRVIERAPRLTRNELKKLSKVVKRAPQPIIDSVLREDSFLTPTIADKVLELPEERQVPIAKEIERLKLTENEAMKKIEASKVIVPEKPAAKQGYLTLEESLPAQYQRQREWNLRQLIGKNFTSRAKHFRFDFVTIGYSQKSLKDLCNSLELSEVTTLIDVRRNPHSMYRPEFNKEKITKELLAIGVEYLHMPELGISREQRDEVYEGRTTASDLLDDYEVEVLQPGGLNKLLETVKGRGTFAIMCTEVDPTNCHRHKIAQALSKNGMVGYDL